MNEVWGRCAEEVSLDLTGSFWTNLLPRVKNEATIKVFASQASEESDWETTAYGLSKRLVSRSRFPKREASASLFRQSSQHGAIAKRLCPGLQIRLVQFDSGSRLQHHIGSRCQKAQRRWAFSFLSPSSPPSPPRFVVFVPTGVPVRAPDGPDAGSVLQGILAGCRRSQHSDKPLFW